MTFTKACELVWYWRHGGDSFTCKLYDLFAKADIHRTYELTRAFPHEAMAYLLWYTADSEQAFFDEHVPPERRLTLDNRE